MTHPIVVTDMDGTLAEAETWRGILVWLAANHPSREASRFVTVRLQARGANRDGLGAVVTLRASGRTQKQALDGKSGYLAQSSLPLYFGLGEAASAEAVTVTWPGGKVQTVRGPIRSGTRLVIRER